MNSYASYKCCYRCPALEKKNTISAKKIYTDYPYTESGAPASCLAHCSTFCLVLEKASVIFGGESC